ncbi:hypothetical protein BDK51DRAFT_52799 [Blyttiomyces helicus]|uniref:Uncharacterized protein n=1 Tax=Blyttiomyces helicus TaxID=388810 RepID=A0A4P9WFH0_9FUNG|nr:hypothetical protein BDK51DRAFT_52799 [Blyttiomyces helicus]|eukprot:RKO91501.1 hypothetical protein BDK51DRAFT_52799 [Blyttiomyces helicus]
MPKRTEIDANECPSTDHGLNGRSENQTEDPPPPAYSKPWISLERTPPSPRGTIPLPALASSLGRAQTDMARSFPQSVIENLTPTQPIDPSDPTADSQGQTQVVITFILAMREQGVKDSALVNKKVTFKKLLTVDHSLRSAETHQGTTSKMAAGPGMDWSDVVTGIWWAPVDTGLAVVDKRIDGPACVVNGNLLASFPTSGEWDLRSPEGAELVGGSLFRTSVSSALFTR